MKAVVPVRASPHRVGPNPEAEGVATHRWLANPADLVALEAAERTAETVVAVAVGDDRAKTAVEAAARAGADETLHVSYDPIADPLDETYAAVVARAVERVGGDVAFVGEAGPTTGVAVAPMTADALGWRCATGVTAVGEDVEGDHDAPEDGLVLQRRLEPGRQEVLTADCPAVVGVDSGFANPTRGTLEDVIAAQQSEPTTVDLERVAPDQSRFGMSVGGVTRREVTANQRVGRGAPPKRGSVEERILRVMGGDDGGDGGDGELVEASPEVAAERVVSLLADRDLL
ncbi:MAG: electron transfer flavoprotein alpha/beta- subunit [Haloarculaceae archaeon]